MNNISANRLCTFGDEWAPTFFEAITIMKITFIHICTEANALGMMMNERRKCASWLTAGDVCYQTFGHWFEINFNCGPIAGTTRHGKYIAHKCQAGPIVHWHRGHQTISIISSTNAFNVHQFTCQIIQLNSRFGWVVCYCYNRCTCVRLCLVRLCVLNPEL